MVYELYIILFGIVFILALASLVLMREKQREANRMQLKQMLHEERMKAMEKGLEVPAEAIHDVTNGAEWASASTLGGSFGHSILWTRIVALCIGLFLMLGGVGMYLGFSVAGEDDFHAIASLGLLPAFAGFGLILFYFLTRNLDQNDRKAGT